MKITLSTNFNINWPVVAWATYLKKQNENGKAIPIGMYSKYFYAYYNYFRWSSFNEWFSYNLLNVTFLRYDFIYQFIKFSIIFYNLII